MEEELKELKSLTQLRREALEAWEAKKEQISAEQVEAEAKKIDDFSKKVEEVLRIKVDKRRVQDVMIFRHGAGYMRLTYPLADNLWISLDVTSLFAVRKCTICNKCTFWTTGDPQMYCTVNPSLKKQGK